MGDPYKEAQNAKQGRPVVKNGYKLAGHDFNFKPAKTVQTKVPNKLPYPYKEHGFKPKIVYKDAEGAVITGPRNFYTTKMKKGRVGKNTFFSGVIPHHPEDPNVERNMKKADMAYH